MLPGDHEPAFRRTLPRLPGRSARLRLHPAVHPARRAAGSLAVIALAGALSAGCGSDATSTDGAGPGADPGPQPTTRVVEPGSTLSPEAAPDGTPGTPSVVGTVARGLEVPWGIAFLPDGSALVTERDTTRVLHLVRTGAGWQTTAVTTVDQASPRGESGLLGIAVSPSYADDQQVFLFVSTEQDNRVVRGTFDGTDLSGLRPVLTGIPNGFIHDGGRLAFGPDGYLYVSTGETGEPPLAQQEGLLGRQDPAHHRRRRPRSRQP